MPDAAPDHPIEIEPHPKRVRITFSRRVVADTTKAPTLYEPRYAPVQYVPRADVDMSLLVRTDRKTRCLYKGEAAYYSIVVAGRVAANAVRTYEQPIPSVAAIAGYVAFYPRRVDVIEEIAEEMHTSLDKTIRSR